MRVGEALIDEFGAFIERAGDRTQSHDLEVIGFGPRRTGRNVITAGRYEVKSLWRRNERSAFDRRFKVGTRGERIYGRRDSQVKAFALTLEEDIERMLDGNVSAGQPSRSMSESVRFVEAAHAFIDDALARRHSKKFEERLARLAGAARMVPSLMARANAVLLGRITNDDILRGFSDLEGIFIVAGPLYTLVTKAEMGSFLAFDSASSEGPKLRMLGVIPSETTMTKQRKEKGKKK